MTTTELDPSAQSRTQASDQRFVDAALDLFVEYGFNGTSLQMIGDRLGVSKAAVAYHFHAKDDLLAAVVEPAFADLRQVLDQADAVRRESARRTQALEGYIAYLIRHRYVSTWLSRDVSALTHPVVLQQLEEFGDRMDGLLVGAEDSRARIWSSAILQALTGPILSATEASDEELGAELETIAHTMIRGYQSARRRGATRDE